MADQIAERSLRMKGPPIDLIKYQDAGHGVMGAPLADPKWRIYWSKLGGSSAGNAAARADGWPKITKFLKAELEKQ
jgi:hypothetical protein